MSLMMRLSDEEIALIEQKRAEEKAKQDELLKSYDHYREEQISFQKLKNERHEVEQENRKKRYETMYNELIAVSKDFKLTCKKVNTKQTIRLYDVDENGREIKYVFDDSGSVIKHIKPKEVVNLDSYNYELSLDYTGKVPEGCKYYVIPSETYSRTGRVNGYKMQVRGTGINDWDKRGQMTKATSVYKKILEIVESKFRQIEYRTEQDQRNDRIQERFKVTFSEFVKNVTSIHESVFYIKLDNGVTINIHGYEDSNGNIRFVKDKISFPYNMDALDLINKLNDIKGEQ